MTTQEAREALLESTNMRKGRRQLKEDQVAATLILEVSRGPWHGDACRESASSVDNIACLNHVHKHRASYQPIRQGHLKANHRCTRESKQQNEDMNIIRSK